MTVGWGIIIFGILSILNTFIGVGLSAIRETHLLRIRLQGELEQAEITAKVSLQADVKNIVKE